METKLTGLSHQPRRLFGLSPWLVIGVSVILGLTIIYLAVRGAEREKEHMSQTLLGRAGALIWALEAGTRTWLGYRSDQDVLQLLVEETARQPDILYLAVVGFDGTIIAHSDPSKVGTVLPTESIPTRDELADLHWRVANVSDKPAFEVYRTFSPVREEHTVAIPHNDHHDLSTPAPRIDASAYDENFVIVGMEQSSFQEALQRDFQNSLISTLVVAALGLGGCISLFWAHNYRRSSYMLMNTQALASEVITNLPLGLVTSDANGHIEIVNKSAEKMLRTDAAELVGKPLAQLSAIDCPSIVDELARGEKVLERETELIVGPDKSIPVRLSASQIRNAEDHTIGHVFIFGDIEEVRRLQTQVQRNERLTALGNLAAGVAHEIRNPLSTIKGFATFIARKLPAGAPEEAAAKTMIIEVNRLNTVVSELLEFARPSTIKGDAKANMNEVIDRALRLADADIRENNVAVVFNPDESLPAVRVNAERLTQALLNLFLNAVQAMPQGGVIRVDAHIQSDTESLYIIVEDNGKGMSEEVRKAIFDPYFTTKPSGTGLGLAIVHQIVEGHGGSVSVRSKPGEGAAFTLRIPIGE